MKSETSATESASNNKEIHDDNDNEIGNSNDLIIEDGFPAFNTFTKAKAKAKQEVNPEPEQEPEPELPRYPFASFPAALTLSNNQLTSLLSDCEKAFTARTKDEDDAYSTGITFFLPAAMKPRCALESLARTIFTAHTSNLIPGKHYDLERSGAEWWTLVLDAASASASTETTSKEEKGKEEEEEEEEYEGDEVGMHYDADYGLEQQLPNYLLHPRVATVTYLSDVGVPTLVLEKRSPPPSDVDKKTLEGAISRGWLSCPLLGKHIAFDGRFLHGAPGAFFPGFGTGTSGVNGGVDASDDGDGEEQTKKRRKLNNGNGNKTAVDTTPDPLANKRITFMVNVWINHCPIDAEPIDDELCSQMETLYWEDDESDTKTNKPKGMLKKGDDEEYQCQPPFRWNLKTVKIEHNQNQQGKNEKWGNVAPSSSSSSLPLVNLASVATNKSKDDEEAGSETTVICNREVTMNFRCTMKECHRVVKEAFDDKGKSVEVAFGDAVLRLEVGNEYVESDSDGENQNQES